MAPVMRFMFAILISVGQSDAHSLYLSGVGEAHKTHSSMGLCTPSFTWEHPATSPGGVVAVLYCLMQHCESHGVLWWKAPEINLEALWGSLMIYDPFKGMRAASLSQLCPIRREEYLQAYV